MARLMYGSIMAKGVKIQYYRTGGEKPPVVFLHGITEYGLSWTRFPLFIEPTYDVVLVDLRGHGLSDKPEKGYRAEQMAEDVYWLIRSLNLIQPVVIGHSMGASVAAALAATYPGMVSGLVLEDPPWSEIVKPAQARMEGANYFLDFLKDLKSKSLKAVIEDAHMIYPQWDEVEYMQWAKGIHLVSLASVQWYLEDQTPWQELIGQIKKPGLLLTAENERGALVTPEVSQQAQLLWKDLVVEHLPGAGHHIHREQYFKFRDLVKLFLRKVL